MPPVKPLSQPVEPATNIVPGSGVSVWDRFKISFETDPKFQKQMLVDAGLDVIELPDGALAVRNEDGTAQRVDAQKVWGDVFGDIADLTGDAMVAIPSGIAAAAGAAAGSVAGPGGAMLGGTLAGSGAAGAADLLRQGIAKAFGSKRGVDLGQTGTEALYGAAGEFGGQAVTKGIAGLYKGAKALRAPEYAKAAFSPEQMKTREAAMELGLDLKNFPPGTQTSHPEVQDLSEIAERASYTRPQLQQSQRALKEDLELVIGDVRRSAWEHGGKVDDVKTGYWPTESGFELQTFAENDLAGAVTAWQENISALADAAMKKMERALPKGNETPVNMDPLKKYIDETVSRLSRGTKNINKEKLAALDELKEDIAEWKTIGDYLEFKSDVGEDLYSSKKYGKQAHGLYAALLGSLEETAQALDSPQASQFYSDMRKMWSRKKELESDPLFRQWFKKMANADSSPEVDIVKLSGQVSKVLKAQSPEQIKKFRQFIGAEGMGNVPPTREGRHAYGKIQQLWIDQILSKAATNGAAANQTVVQGNTMLKELDGIGKPVLKEAIGEGAATKLYALGNLLNNETIKRHLSRNFSGTAHVENVYDRISTTWAEAGRKLGQRQARNKVSSIVRPSGDAMAGKEYYLEGKVPTINQITRAVSKKDPGKPVYGLLGMHFDSAVVKALEDLGVTEAGSLWRMAIQTAQQTYRDAAEQPQPPRTPVRQSPAQRILRH